MTNQQSIPTSPTREMILEEKIKTLEIKIQKQEQKITFLRKINRNLHAKSYRQKINLKKLIQI